MARRYSDRTDKQLAQDAKALGVIITEKMTREDVVKAISAEMLKRQADKDKVIADNGGKVIVRYIKEGQVSKYGFVFKKGTQMAVPENIARMLVDGFKGRFQIIKKESKVKR